MTDFYSRLCCIIVGLKSVREVFADEKLFWRDKGLVFYSHEALRADEEELWTFFVLFPVMTCLERLWLIGNKTTVITWDNLFEIIKNPLTWIVLILLGILLVFGTMFEQFALYDVRAVGGFLSGASGGLF